MYLFHLLPEEVFLIGWMYLVNSRTGECSLGRWKRKGRVLLGILVANRENICACEVKLISYVTLGILDESFRTSFLVSVPMRLERHRSLESPAAENFFLVNSTILPVQGMFAIN